MKLAAVKLPHKVGTTARSMLNPNAEKISKFDLAYIGGVVLTSVMSQHRPYKEMGTFMRFVKGIKNQKNVNGNTISRAVKLKLHTMPQQDLIELNKVVYTLEMAVPNTEEYKVAKFFFRAFTKDILEKIVGKRPSAFLQF